MGTSVRTHFTIERGTCTAAFTSLGKKGDFSFIGLGTGKWTLTASVPGYAPVGQAIRYFELAALAKNILGFIKK